MSVLRQSPSWYAERQAKFGRNRLLLDEQVPKVQRESGVESLETRGADKATATYRALQMRNQTCRNPQGNREAALVGVATDLSHQIYPLVGLCRAAGLPEPHTEYEFSPTRAYRFDYAFPSILVAVECEGGIWRKGGGAHSHPLNILRDMEKYNHAAMLGWRILRYQPEKLMQAIPDLRGLFGKVAA